MVDAQRTRYVEEIGVRGGRTQRVAHRTAAGIHVALAEIGGVVAIVAPQTALHQQPVRGVPRADGIDARPPRAELRQQIFEPRHRVALILPVKPVGVLQLGVDAVRIMPVDGPGAQLQLHRQAVCRVGIRQAMELRERELLPRVLLKAHVDVQYLLVMKKELLTHHRLQVPHPLARKIHIAPIAIGRQGIGARHAHRPGEEADIQLIMTDVHPCEAPFAQHTQRAADVLLLPGRVLQRAAYDGQAEIVVREAVGRHCIVAKLLPRIAQAAEHMVRIHRQFHRTAPVQVVRAEVAQHRPADRVLLRYLARQHIEHTAQPVRSVLQRGRAFHDLHFLHVILVYLQAVVAAPLLPFLLDVVGHHDDAAAE